MVTNFSFFTTTTTAWRQGRWESMALYTYRYGHEYQPRSYRDANPQDTRTDSVLAKTVYNSEYMGEFKWTAEMLRKDTRTQVVSEQIGFTTPAPGRYRIVEVRGATLIVSPR